MFDALRTGDVVAVRGYTALPAVILEISKGLDDQELARPGTDEPLISASEAHLMADPLLSLELEMRNASMAETIASQERQNAETAKALLTRWASPAAEIFDDQLTVAEADALSCWANSVYIDLRMTECATAGRQVAVGESDGVDQLIAELTGAPMPEERISFLAAIFALLAEMLSAAVSGRRSR